MIRQHGGIFGRNPAFNNVEVGGDLNVQGYLTAQSGASVSQGLTYTDGGEFPGRILRCSGSGGEASWDVLTFTVQNQVFTSSGTWTKPTNAIAVIVEMCGGGGGGGNSSTVAVGNGGQGGVFESRVFAAGDLPATVSVTCGAAGASGNGTGGESLFGAFTTDSNSYLRAPGGGPNSTSARTSLGILAQFGFAAGGTGTTVAGQPGGGGRVGGQGPGGGGGGGRAAAGGDGGKASANQATTGVANTGGGAAGGANNANGTSSTTFHAQTYFGNGGGGGGGNGNGGNGFRGSGGGGAGYMTAGTGTGGTGGVGVVVVRTVRYV